ncbi:MAG: MBL fold metallo-hydrolase, partial [Pseudomonadota bacterium]
MNETRGAAKIVTPISDPPPFKTAVELEPGLLWFRLPLPMALDHVNIYAFRDPDGWTIVDTGLNSQRTRDLWQYMLDGPLAEAPVRRVILTHHHPDHVGLVGWFQTEFGAELLAPRTAWLFARMLMLDVQDTPTDETLAFWRAAGMPEGAYAARLKQ